MKGNSHLARSLGLLTVSQGLISSWAFTCNNYSGGSLSRDFCVETACEAYCATHNIPEYCMEEHYVSSGLCTQIAGHPAAECTGVVGNKPEHSIWCQTVACDYVRSLGHNDLTQGIISEFPNYCERQGEDTPGGEEENPSGTCFAPTSWVSGACKLCAEPNGTACPEFGWTPCSSTLAACTGDSGQGGAAADCYAPSNWTGGPCQRCAAPNDNQCPELGWTPCFDSLSACGGGTDDGSDGGGVPEGGGDGSCWAHTGWTTTTCGKCAAPNSGQCPDFGWTNCFDSEAACNAQGGGDTGDSGGSGSVPDVPEPSESVTTTTTTTTTTTSTTTPASGGTTTTTTTTTTSTTTPASGGDGGCWAYTSWGTTTCARCTAPTSGQCPGFGWTNCFDSEAACNAQGGGDSSGGGDSGSGGSGGGDSGGGDSGGGSSGGSGPCAVTCPANTLDGNISRPTLLGPNCYDSTYGSQFGPNWKPSGKTRIEKFLPTPTAFMNLVRTLSEFDSMPMLRKSWGVVDCPAATAVWENFVCSLELMEATGKEFAPINNSRGYTVADLFNTGDEETDKIELAAFFSHKMKEVARFQIWEEAAFGYCESSDLEFPCGSGQSYHGRGPVQISWNFNYGPFSEWWYGDRFVLLNNPDRVDPEGPMGFIAALWFWATPRDFTSGQPLTGTLRTRDAIIHWNDGKLNAMYADGRDYDRYSGLGLSTNVINGGIECTWSSQSHIERVAYYLTAVGRLGITYPVEDRAACLADSRCAGLYRGCSSAAGGATCQPTTGVCGHRDYVNGWAWFGCSA